MMKKSLILAGGLAVALLIATGRGHVEAKAAEGSGPKAEHAGKGAEHAGEAAGKARSYIAKHIKKAMTAHIKKELARGGGVLKIVDPRTKKPLELEFVKIHDPVRRIEGKGYFACTDFHPKGAEAGKVYDLDFWLDPEDGELQVVDTRIHKHPVRKGGRWVKKARYTFVNDKPVEVK